jgi:hypothetical protein
MAFGMLDGVVSLTAGSRLGDTQKVFLPGSFPASVGVFLGLLTITWWATQFDLPSAETIFLRFNSCLPLVQRINSSSALEEASSMNPN